VHRDGHGYPVADTVAVDGRIPVLAYGSNACPAKITWLRENLGLTGDVTVVRVRCTGMAAVWAAGLRARDGQRTATLAAAPGAVETHAIWLATPEQLAVLDVCEGRGDRYHLARLRSGVTQLDGTPLPPVLAYVGASPARLPLLVHGAPVRTSALGQAEALALRGIPAPSHGLDVVIV
jgi:hypothetical protein